MYGLGGNLVSKTSIEQCSRFAHASSSTENEWSEGGQLDFVDRLLVQGSFDLLMVGVTGRDGNLLLDGACGQQPRNYERETCEIQDPYH